MKTTRFEGNFTQQEPIPADAIARAVEVMQSGRLHRYNVAGEETAEVVLLEQEFAASTGARFCLACTSGGYALHVALRAWGLKQGEQVLTNAFTLSPVPGAIHAAGGQPVLVETTRDLVIDLEDLEQKIKSSSAKVLMLSHMRGHIVDMDALMILLGAHDVALIEDCAHTMGADWNGKPSGSYGVVSCFSTQTYKHINSGEGGLLISDDPEIVAKATVMSGSYMLYDRHGAGPDDSHYQSIKYEMPNMSGRMDNLRAAILRPQLANLSVNAERWNNRYHAMIEVLRKNNRLYLPWRDPKEGFVASSLQFLVDGITTDESTVFLEACRENGVELKWFGAAEPAGYTSKYDSWRYMKVEPQPVTDNIMSTLFDLRLPLTFSIEDCEFVANVINNSLPAAN